MGENVREGLDLGGDGRISFSFMRHDRNHHAHYLVGGSSRQINNRVDGEDVNANDDRMREKEEREEAKWYGHNRGPGVDGQEERGRICAGWGWGRGS